MFWFYRILMTTIFQRKSRRVWGGGRPHNIADTNVWWWGIQVTWDTRTTRIWEIMMMQRMLCLFSFTTFPHISDARSPTFPSPTIVLLFISQMWQLWVSRSQRYRGGGRNWQSIWNMTGHVPLCHVNYPGDLSVLASLMNTSSFFEEEDILFSQ